MFDQRTLSLCIIPRVRSLGFEWNDYRQDALFLYNPCIPTYCSRPKIARICRPLHCPVLSTRRMPRCVLASKHGALPNKSFNLSNRQYPIVLLLWASCREHCICISCVYTKSWIVLCIAASTLSTFNHIRSDVNDVTSEGASAGSCSL